MARLIIFISIIFTLHACKKRESSEGPAIFKLNLASPLTSLDPAFASDQPNSWAAGQIFNGLVQLNNQLEINPCIAKNWDISDDNRVYTFTLSDNIFFHTDSCFGEKGSRKLTATDVVYSFRRLMDAKTAARGYWVFQNIVAGPESFVALNDTTVQITLITPFAPFLQRLAMPYCAIVPKEAVETYGKDFRSHPVGTGPFKFKKWVEGNLLILHKNESYFEVDEKGNSLPYLDAINIKFVGNKSTEFLQFMNGELDFVSDIDASLKDQILTKDGQLKPEYSGKFELLKGPYLNVEYLTILMNRDAAVMQQNPLVFKEVRQAINYAINKEEMLYFMRNNRGLPAKAGIVPTSLYHDPLGNNFGYEYNPEKAKKLLESAGFADGIGLPEILLHTTSEYVSIATYLKDKLEDLGLAIKIEVVDPRVLREMRVNEETAFFRSSWIADYSDPESFLQMFYGHNGAPPNYSRYHNANFDSLYDIAVKETNTVERNIRYRELDSIMMLDAPIIPLYYDEVYRFTRSGITGLEPDAMNMLRLKTVRFN